LVPDVDQILAIGVDIGYLYLEGTRVSRAVLLPWLLDIHGDRCEFVAIEPRMALVPENETNSLFVLSRKVVLTEMFVEYTLLLFNLCQVKGLLCE